MWAYNSILKCTGRVPVSLTVLQKSSLLSRCAFSSSSMQRLLVPAQGPSVLTQVLCTSLKRNIHLSKCFQSDFNTNVVKDVLLFKFDNVKLFKMITLFGCVNFCMFMAISLNIYTVLTKESEGEGESPSEFDNETGERSVASVERSVASVDSSTLTQPKASWSIPTLFSKDKTGSDGEKVPISSTYILTGLCGVTFVLGYILLAGTWIYCTTQVRYLVLRKGGKQVTVVTHGVFGNNITRTWNLDQVNVRGNRSISSAVLLNAKGKAFSYILDKRGTYTNSRLFDLTVGVPRSLK